MEQIWSEMFQAAKAVQNGRKISDYVDAGGVAAAILPLIDKEKYGFRGQNSRWRRYPRCWASAQLPRLPSQCPFLLPKNSEGPASKNK